MGGAGQETPKALLGTAYIYNNCRLVQRAATILGKKKMRLYFKDLADKIRPAFNSRFLDKNYRRVSERVSMRLCVTVSFWIGSGRIKRKGN